MTRFGPYLHFLHFLLPPVISGLRLGGVVSVVYFSCGAVSSLLAGRMADVMKRINVVPRRFQIIHQIS